MRRRVNGAKHRACATAVAGVSAGGGGAAGVRGRAGVLTGVRGRIGRLGRQRRLGGVGRRARAGGRRRRIFRGAGGGRRRRAGGRRAERDQPQQRHAPPPEHGGQRAGSAPDAARGPLATEIRAPLTRAPASSLPHPGIRAASGRLAKRRGCARAATRRLGRRSRERTTAPEHYFGSDAPRRCRRPPASRCQFYAKLRAGGDAICTTPWPPASAPPVRCSITFCRDLPFSLRGFFFEEVLRVRTRTPPPPPLDTCATRLLKIVGGERAAGPCQ